MLSRPTSSRVTCSLSRRSTLASWISLTAAVLSLSGCAEEAPGGDGGGAPMGALAITDANNYTTVSLLTLPVVDTAPGADLEICWDAITQDLQCHGVTALSDVDNVTLLRFDDWTPEDIAYRLGIGNVGQNDLAVLADWNTDHVDACTNLGALSTFGTPLDVATDYAENPQSHYVMVFSQGTIPGVGALTMTFLRPTATSTNTRVDAPQGCPGLLDFTADLKDLAVTVPSAGPWVLDWAGVTTDSTGLPLKFTQIDSVLIGFYQGRTIADIEAQILDIELIATSLYEAPHTGKKNIDLSTAIERTTSAPFAGFDRVDGVWLAAMMCSTCQNPAPLVLTVLQPG